MPANRVSVAGLLRASRNLMCEYLVMPEPGQSLWNRLAEGTIDMYQRKFKASRDYVRKKKETPIGPPRIRQATPQEVDRAEQNRT